MKIATDLGDLMLTLGDRTIRFNCGIVGLSFDELRVFEGYDGSVTTPGPHIDPKYDSPLSPEQCVELGRFMVARWQAFVELHDKSVKVSEANP